MTQAGTFGCPAHSYLLKGRPSRQRGREGDEMITQYRLGLIAVAWIMIQAILVADVIYRVSQSSL